MRHASRTRTRSTGYIIVSIMAVLGFLGTMLLSLIVLSNANLQRARGRVLMLQAQYAAESAVDSAIAQLNNNNTSYAGTPSDVALMTSSQYRATYSVTVANGSDSKERIMTAVGKVYMPSSATTPRYTRKIKVTVQRSSTTTSSAVLSRNIIDIASGVKNIRAKDIFVNGYIRLNKNTTNLIAENITVGGKYTGAGNCSISGAGNLVKPATFTDPGQTKTNLLLAYNNCISPPGNTSNADFNVSANQSVIAAAQSTYLPWDQMMDNSYQNSPTGCNDWTTGGSPRTIPSIGNDKKTHYPDSGSNVISSCGTSGNLNLGSNQYNINNHAHIRASLCAVSACGPVFYNPSTETRFIFVEGIVKFNSVRTAAGSGPLVIVSYGADVSSGDCPYGSSIYLGKENVETNAPDLYLLSTGSVCLADTKFGANPALGGLGGKNIYVATNSGTPFDLGLDTSFPVDDIPLDLAWRAVRYQRQ